MHDDDLSPAQLVTEFVLAHKNRGSFLSAHDYHLIQKWLAHCPDVDFLLLLLSDKLPALFAHNPRRSLQALDKTIMHRITRQATDITFLNH